MSKAVVFPRGVYIAPSIGLRPGRDLGILEEWQSAKPQTA
jgi:hypothetical protein